MKQRNVNRSLNLSLLFSFFFTMFFVIGCSVTYSNGEESENVLAGTKVMVTITATSMPAKSSSTATFTSTATSLPTETPSPVSSPTTTIETIPTKMPTASPTSMPTWTPLPTFAPSQRGQIYNELMNSNGGCTLPCWWGFELGKTSLNEVRQFYAAFDAFLTEHNDKNGVTILEVLFVDPQIENGIQIPHTFVAQDNVLVESQIQLSNQPSYQIESILQLLGKPSDIWMWTIPEPYEDKLPADFILYFPNHGVLLGYRTGSIKSNEYVKVCFDKVGGATIDLWNPSIWDPNGNKDILERANQTGSAFRLDGYYPVDEVSNWDVEQFYTVLSNSTHTECLETPSNLWSSP